MMIPTELPSWKSKLTTSLCSRELDSLQATLVQEQLSDLPSPHHLTTSDSPETQYWQSSVILGVTLGIGDTLCGQQIFFWIYRALTTFPKDAV